MAARVSRAMMNTAEVVDLLNHDDDADVELDDFPGSDDELGFEEVDLKEDEDAMYGITVTQHS